MGGLINLASHPELRDRIWARGMGSRRVCNYALLDVLVRGYGDVHYQ